MKNANNTVASGFASDLKLMMDAWTKIESAARAENPKATDQEIYEISKSAMNRALHLA